MIKRTYTSKRGLLGDKNPEDIFHKNKHDLLLTINDKLYLYKKLPLGDGVKPQDFIEVQIIDRNFKNPYFVEYYDYIIEKEYEDNKVTENLYLIYEPADSDLYNYVKAHGPLPSSDFIELLQCIISANYAFQAELNIPHKHIHPQNIGVYLNENQLTKSSPKFKLSFYDEDGEMNSSHYFNSLAFKAPEIVLSNSQSPMNKKYSFEYCAPSEFVALYTEILQKNNQEDFRSDLFSAGLVLLWAANKKHFTLRKNSSSGVTVVRSGDSEMKQVQEWTSAIRERYNSFALEGIVASMLNYNPFMRSDFEELALRMNKMKVMSPLIPKIDILTNSIALRNEVENYKQEAKDLAKKLEDSKSDIQQLEFLLRNLKMENVKIKHRMSLKSKEETSAIKQIQEEYAQKSHSQSNIKSQLSAMSASIESRSKPASTKGDSLIDTQNSSFEAILPRSNSNRKPNELRLPSSKGGKEEEKHSTPGNSFEENNLLFGRRVSIDLSPEEEKDLNNQLKVRN